MNTTNLFHLCVIGEPLFNMPIWRKPNFYTTFLPSPLELKPYNQGNSYDFIFLSTPINWNHDGSYNDDRLMSDVEIIHKRGYTYQLITTAVMPMGQSEKMECHYVPLPNRNDTEYPFLCGCTRSTLIDTDAIRELLAILFGSPRIEIRPAEEAEMIFLIHMCQSYINHSFLKEISHFCSKNKIVNGPVTDLFTTPQTTPILVYMVRKMEDIKLDCPILYSCLFRQRYIDIPI